MRKILLAVPLAAILCVAPVVSAVEQQATEVVSTVSEIQLSQEGDIVMWTVDGEATKGFKVTWSKNEGPTYPPRNGDKAEYHSSPDTREAKVYAFDGSGVYNVRVCEYMGDGTCGTYSNQIKVDLQKEESLSSFTDLKESNENFDAIHYLKDKQVIQGYEDGSFKPENKINRAEFLKIVMEISSHQPGGENCYSDVTDQWFAQYVCKATELGLVKGYEDGSFKPEQYINFAEASKIIVNTLSLETDTTDDETWFKKYVKSMELLSAIPTSVDSFDKKITRGEMAEMVYRIHAEDQSKTSIKYDDLQPKQELSIQLSPAGDNKVSWSVVGEAPKGFKVTWSKNEGPTYPPRNGDKAEYHSSPDTREAKVYAFDGSGTYTVRVCEYMGDGTCGAYSNPIKVNLTK